MPFTLAHPAIIIPIYDRFRKYLSLSALIIGTFAPDLSYFTPIKVDREISHSFESIYLYTMPMGILLYFFFQYYLKWPIISTLPKRLGHRLPVSAFYNRKLDLSFFSVIIPSLFIGASSHLMWDNCTHDHTFVASQFPILSQEIISLNALKIYGYQIAQHVSSVFGLIVVAFFLLRYTYQSPINSLEVYQKRTLNLNSRIKFYGFFLVSIYSVSHGFIEAFKLTGPIDEINKIRFFIGGWVVSGINAFVYSSAIICLFIRYKLWRKTGSF
jgi:hypothetical protein